MSRSLLPLLLLVLDSGPVEPPAAAAAAAAAALRTFPAEDPLDGRPLQCAQCRPGTYLERACTATTPSVCAPCPAGSFTQLWNYISRCLPCGVCARDQVLSAACRADANSRCVCRPGFFAPLEDVPCMPHRACAAGSGVTSAGTADEDTVCHSCPAGAFSDVLSAEGNCTLHRDCAAEGRELLLNGTAWHDSVCANCTGPAAADAAGQLRHVIRALFHRQRPLRRLRRIVVTLPSEERREQRRQSLLQMGVQELLQEAAAWTDSATPAQIRTLPDIFQRAGATADVTRLQKKLQTADANLNLLCAGQH